MNTNILALAAALCGGALGIAHFALAPDVTGHKLPRVAAYAVGVGVIAGVTTLLAVLYAVTVADVLWLLWVSIAASALATLGGRIVRRWFDGQHAIRERDELLRRQRGAE